MHLLHHQLRVDRLLLLVLVDHLDLERRHLQLHLVRLALLDLLEDPLVLCLLFLHQILG